MSRATSTTIRGTTATSTRTTTRKRPSRDTRSAARPIAIVVLLGWTLFAFAGLYPWTTIPLVIGAAALTILERPAIGRRESRWLDLALAAGLIGIALQLVGLPPDLRARLAPAAVAFDRAMRFDIPGGALAARPLSSLPSATAHALLLDVSIVALFWSARSLLGRGGIRTVVRGIAGLGLVLAPLTIVQHATSPRLLYGLWQPSTGNARPYGPFVNRNDLAVWLVMAIPLTIGYAIARVESRRTRTAPFDPEAALDAKAVWLGASICLMSAALLSSLSRSGLIGAAVAALSLVMLSRRKTTVRRRASLLAGFAVVAALAMLYTNVGELTTRLGNALTEGVGGRLSIWRQTWPMMRAFWPFGVGIGAYQDAMILYERSSPLFYINHAHSQYLQFLTEGGALVGVPVAVGFIAGGWAVLKRLRMDRTPVFWIRAGAASGLLGVAAQSLWETTLRMPANALLLAVLAAVALHTGARVQSSR